MKTWILRCAFLLTVCSGLGAQTEELPFILPTDPNRWTEEEFEARFKGTYGINAAIEPELDVDNFNIYEGVLAFLDNREAAITYIQNSIKTLTEQGIEVSASLYFLLGNFYFENDQHDLAVEQYIQAVHKHPTFLRAYENLGYSLMQTGQNEKALPVLLKALELGSNDSQIHGLIGFLYLDKELYMSALTAFEWAMVFNPRNNTWRFGIFQSLINLNRNEDALGVAEEILLFDPDTASNWQNAASLSLRLGKEDEAISQLEVMHHLGGATYLSRRLLGNIYFNREMVDEAYVEFLELIKLAENPEQLEDLLSVCEGLLYYDYVDQSQELFNQLDRKARELGFELDPESMEFIQAAIHLDKQEFEEARSLLKRVLDRNPAHTRALLLMAESLIGLQRFDEAGIYFELAQAYPDVAYDAYYRHAQLLLGQNLTEEAVAKLREAYTLKPSDDLAEIIRSISETGRMLR